MARYNGDMITENIIELLSLSGACLNIQMYTYHKKFDFSLNNEEQAFIGMVTASQILYV